MVNELKLLSKLKNLLPTNRCDTVDESGVSDQTSRKSLATSRKRKSGESLIDHKIR